MIVAELKAVLEHVPDDLEVIVQSSGAKHVGIAERQPARREPSDLFGARARTPGALVLRGYDRVFSDDVWDGFWWREPPEFELRGPFRKANELDAKLDAFSPRGSSDSQGGDE